MNYDPIPFAEAMSIILKSTENISIDEEVIPLSCGCGRLLTRNIISSISHPPCNVSSMDGYAFRHADLQRTDKFYVHPESAKAGSNIIKSPLNEGYTIQIFTGAPMPTDADTVVAYEDVLNINDSTIIIPDMKYKLGMYVRPEGMDFRSGDPILNAGRILSPEDIALIAAMGISFITVKRKLGITVISTGDEIIMPGISGNKENIDIFASSNIALLAMLNDNKSRASMSPVIPDCLDNVIHAINAASISSDIVITIGGAGCGKHDLIESAVTKLGGNFLIRGVLMRPGKPFSLAQVGKSLVVCLPGNPVSSILCTRIMVQPLIRSLLRFPLYKQQPHLMKLTSSLAKNSERTHFMRGRTHSTNSTYNNIIHKVTPCPKQDSIALAELAMSNALIVREPFDPSKKIDDVVSVYYINDL